MRHGIALKDLRKTASSTISRRTFYIQLDPSERRILSEGLQAVFRRTVRKRLPASPRAEPLSCLSDITW